jgi:hypothetical protein
MLLYRSVCLTGRLTVLCLQSDAGGNLAAQSTAQQVAAIVLTFRRHHPGKPAGLLVQCCVSWAAASALGRSQSARGKA